MILTPHLVISISTCLVSTSIGKIISKETPKTTDYLC